jgi:predicted nucleic acid-binding protein
MNTAITDATTALSDSFLAVRSSKLKELRISINTLRQLNYPTATIAKILLVIDTNIVLGELRWLASKRRTDDAKTSLMEVMEAETVQLYAPPILFAEVEEKIPLISSTQGIDLDAMLQHWALYKTKITLAIPDENLVKALQSGVDPDDAQFVALQQTLGADGVLSKDAHITAMGGNRISLDCIFYLRDYSRTAAIEVNIKVAGANFTLAGLTAIRACVGGIQALSRGIKAAPDWLKFALLLATFLTLANPRSRAKVVGTVNSLLSGAATAAPAVLNLVSVAAQLANENESQAKFHLANALADISKLSSSG